MNTESPNPNPKHNANGVEQSPPLWDDPLVEEVRAARRRLWEASGKDVQRFIDQSRQAAERRNAAKTSRGRSA